MRYLTVAGAHRIQDELIALRKIERPKIVREVADAAAQGDRSENAEYIYGKKKLREIDRRMRFLVKQLDQAELIEPAARRGETRVFFGATVDLEDENGHKHRYQVVGPDEADVKLGRISFKAPFGALLMGKRSGESFVLKLPHRETEYEITKVEYV